MPTADGSSTKAYRANAASPQPTQQLSDLSAGPLTNGTGLTGCFTNDTKIDRALSNGAAT